MLLSCKLGCSGKKGTTTASLDLESNKVYCDFCKEEIEVSSFFKNAMKQQGHVLKPTPKAFQFKCDFCKRTVATEIDQNDALRGIGCEKSCKFTVSKFIILGMKNTSILNKDKDIENDSDE
jgi:hypothetical protein